MLPNFDQREMPRALQHLMARGQASVATALPRRSFLKLAGAGGLALGAFPQLATAQARTPQSVDSSHATAVGLRADRAERRGHGHHQPARVRPGRADRPADAAGRGARRRLAPRAQPQRLERPGLSRPALRHPPHRRFALDQEQLHAVPRTRCARPRDVDRPRPQRAGTWTWPACARRPARYWAREAARRATANWPRPRWRCPCRRRCTLKNPKDFRIIGRPTTRLDARAKSSGRQDFGIDTRLPGQLTAVVAHPPVFGAKLASLDDSAARAIKGVKAVLRVPIDRGGEGVAVVADGYWPAKQGRDALKLQWDSARVEKVGQRTPAGPVPRSGRPARPARVRRRHGAAGHRAAATASRVRLPLPGPCTDGAAELHRAVVRRRAPSCGSAPSAPAWTLPPPRRCWASSPNR